MKKALLGFCALIASPSYAETKIDSANPLPQDHEVRSSGLLEISLGWVSGHMKSSIQSARPAVLESFLAQANPSARTTALSLFRSDRLRGQGFSGKLCTGWICRLPRSIAVIGLKAGGALTSTHGKISYPWAVSGSNQALTCTWGTLKIKDRGYLEVSFQLGAALGSVFLYATIGCAGHILTARVSEINPPHKFKARILPCLLTGAGAKVYLSPQWAVGFNTHLHFAGVSRLRQVSGTPADLNGQVGGFATKVRPLLIESLATLTFLLPAR